MDGLIDPRLVKVRAGARGSGWAVGTRGILTARHVIAPRLNDQVNWCVAAPDPTAGAREFHCDVVWHNPDRDLALLCVAEEDVPQWVATVGATPAAVLAEVGTRTVAAEAVGYPDAALAERSPVPDIYPGVLLPAQAVVTGRMPFDVAASVPRDSILWQGMSGAAVRDPHGRLLGVILEADQQRQQRRLYAATLPNLAVDTRFAEALTIVGAAAVVEASDAPANRDLLALLDPTGRPYPVAAVPELGDLGIRRARTDIDTHGDPYYPYVSRNLDLMLREALDRRVTGTERRALVLVGEAMSGKSRTLIEALRRHPQLSGWPLHKPHRTSDLRQVVRCAIGRGVVWLDDINTYAIGLDAALHSLTDAPGVILAATLRTDQLQLLQDQPNTRVAWDVLTDDRLVEIVKSGPNGAIPNRLGSITPSRSSGTRSREAAHSAKPSAPPTSSANGSTSPAHCSKRWYHRHGLGPNRPTLEAPRGRRSDALVSPPAPVGGHAPRQNEAQ